MAEESQVISCHTLDAWNEQLNKAKEAKQLVVVDFTASWCPPCRMMAPIFAGLAKKFPNAVFLKVDVDELKTVAADLDVEAMPTFIFLIEGKVVHKIVGAQKEELEKKLAEHSAQSTTATA